MRRKASLSHEKLVEEARFVLENAQRSDVFGEQVELAEAERVLEPSVSLPFKDFVGFLTKYGYLRLENEGRILVVTSGGREAASGDEPEFRARVARHFARELTAAAGRPRSEPTALPMPLSVDGPGATAVVRSRRPFGVASAPPANEVLDRRYERRGLIDRSTFGVVHRGRHISLGRSIAIKEATSIFQFASYLPRDTIVTRIRTVVETHARLSHPHVAQIIDQNTEREHPYFVLELAEGGNLRRRLEAAESRQLELPVAVRAFLQVAHALGHAHAHGVVHLGLKPENVLFDGQGNVKLTDFGMARVLEHPPEAGPAPVVVGGSGVGYFAPERLQPGLPVELGPSADIYALGIIVYEMLTGRLPGRRSPLPSVAREGVPEAFDEVFDKMTRDALDERYASIDEVLEGVYQAFDASLVYEPGAILTWAADPSPLPEPEPEPEPEEAEPIEEVGEDSVLPLEEDAPTPPPVAARAPNGHTDRSPAADDLDLGGSRSPRRGPPPPPEE